PIKGVVLVGIGFHPAAAKTIPNTAFPLKGKETIKSLPRWGESILAAPQSRSPHESQLPRPPARPAGRAAVAGGYPRLRGARHGQPRPLLVAHPVAGRPQAGVRQAGA